MTLSPSQEEVVHFVNDSYIVTCNGHNQTRVRWMNPKQGVIEDAKGRVHVEEKPGGMFIVFICYNTILQKKKLFTGPIALVFELISLADRGEWTCQGEDENLQKTFNMIINRK